MDLLVVMLTHDYLKVSYNQLEYIVSIEEPTIPIGRVFNYLMF